MRIIKSLLVVVLVLGLVVGGFVGCGGGESVITEESNTTTIEKIDKKYSNGNEIAFAMSAELLKDFSGSESAKVKLEKYSIVKITEAKPTSSYYKVEIVEPEKMLGDKGWIEADSIEIKSHICTSKDYTNAKNEFATEVRIADSKPNPKPKTTHSTKPAPKPAPKATPKPVSNYYSDKIISCNLPANWEGSFLDCYGGKCESELSTPAGSWDFSVAIGIYNHKDLLDYGSIESAIMVTFEESYGDSSWYSYNCKIGDDKHGGNSYKFVTCNITGKNLYMYYTSSGNDFYYIEIVVEETTKNYGVTDILANLKFKDL